MKTCTKCNESKPEQEFDKKGKGLCSHCKTCRRAYVKSHYERNKDYYKAKARKLDAKVKMSFNQFKETLSCTDCGISFKGKACICDFHHLDGNRKEANIASLWKSGKRVEEELS